MLPEPTIPGGSDANLDAADSSSNAADAGSAAAVANPYAPPAAITPRGPFSHGPASAAPFALHPFTAAPYLTVEDTQEERDLQEAQAIHRRSRRKGALRALLPEILTALGGILLLQYLKSADSRQFQLLLAAFGVYFLIVVPIRLRGFAKGRGKGEPAERGPIRYDVHGDGLRLFAGGIDVSVNWSFVHRAILAPQMVLLLRTKRKFYMLPRHRFQSEEDWEKFLDLLRKNVRNVRVLR